MWLARKHPEVLPVIGKLSYLLSCRGKRDLGTVRREVRWLPCVEPVLQQNPSCSGTASVWTGRAREKEGLCCSTNERGRLTIPEHEHGARGLRNKGFAQERWVRVVMVVVVVEEMQSQKKMRDHTEDCCKIRWWSACLPANKKKGTPKVRQTFLAFNFPSSSGKSSRMGIKHLILRETLGTKFEGTRANFDCLVAN